MKPEPPSRGEAPRLGGPVLEETIINQSIIVTTLFHKIPPHLPLQKGGIIPPFGRRPIGPLARRAKRG